MAKRDCREMVPRTVILEQEKIIESYSKMLHSVLEELAQHRNVEAEEIRLESLDEKGCLPDG